jgi:hypothetical protein
VALGPQMTAVAGTGTAGGDERVDRTDENASGPADPGQAGGR